MSRTMARRRGRLMPVIVTDLIVFLLAALAYSQHAKPYCLQQPHSLPPASSVLKAYPCDGGPAKRALYIVRNIFGVYHDMMRLGPNDRWASFQLMIVALTQAARLTLPRKWFWLLRTSFLSQLHRLIPLVYLLIASYYSVPPSSVGKWYLITHPALDLLANFVFPVNPISECVYGVTSIMLVTAIWSRFAYLVAGSSAVSGNVLTVAGAALSQGADRCGVGTYGVPAQQAEGAGIVMVCEAAAAAASGSSTNVATSPISLVASASADYVSPYYLGTWLPFQLLFSLACITATMILERWRGPPIELAGVWGRSSLVRLLWTAQLTCQEEHPGCGSAGTADESERAPRDGDSGPAATATVSCCSGNGGVNGCAGGDRMSMMSIGGEVRSKLDRGCDGKSLCGMGELGAEDVDLIGTASGKVKEMHDRQVRVSHNNNIGEVPVSLFEAAAPSKALDDVIIVGAELANRNHQRCDGGHDSKFSTPDHVVTRDTVTANAAVVAVVDLATHESGYSGEVGKSMDAAESAETEGQALRWYAGFPVRIAPGSSSGVGFGSSVSCRDSELMAEGDMLGVIDVVDLEAEEEGNIVGPRSDGSSRVDVARHDQQVRAETVVPLQSQTQAREITGDELAAGHMGGMHGLPATMASVDAMPVIASNLSTIVSPSASVSEPPDPAARYRTVSVFGVGHSNGVMQRSNRDDAYAPDRDHDRAHRLLRSISSQVSPPAEEHLHPQEQGPLSAAGPEAVNQFLSPEQQQRQLQGLRARHLVQRGGLQQPQQAHPHAHAEGQGLWALRSSSEGAASTAAVMAAAQLARRPAYVPRVRIVTTHIKVQGAQPEQLQNGYTERLENVASAAGQRLIGVYVRAGCIELVLDSADWGEVNSSDGGDIIETVMQDPRGRESGPLPAPLQPRPSSQPAYWSAPNTPLRLQRRQQQQETLIAERLLHPLQEQYDQQGMPQFGAHSLHPHGSAGTQLQPSGLHAPQEPATGASPGSTSSAVRAGPLPSLAMPRSGVAVAAAAIGAGGQGYGHSGGSRSSVYGFGGGGGTAGPGGSGSGGTAGIGGSGSGGTAGIGGSGGTAGIGGNNSSGADLDLGAVIRALQLHRVDGSADSTNDLASELDMDMECGDRLDHITSGLSSGGSGLEANSKETSIGSGGRHGGGDPGVDALSPAALGLTMTGSGVAANAVLRQPLQQQALISNQQQLQDGGTVPAAAIGSTTASISRQALVLGGPGDPLAPGIVSLNPRVFSTAPVVITASSSGGATVIRFSVLVRRVSTAPFTAVPVVAGVVTYGVTVGDLEFTMRSRGEYLPLRAVRMRPVTAAVRVRLPPQFPTGSGAAAAAAAAAAGGIAVSASMGNIALGHGSGSGVLPGMVERFPSEGVRDTSSYIDTGSSDEGGRPLVAWTWHESYTLELLEPPQLPGLLLLDLRGVGNGGADYLPPRAVPLVAVADAHAAYELQEAAESWEGTPSALDDLLLDLGTWLHHASQPPQGLSAPCCMMVDGAMPSAMMFPRLDQRLRALGQHLLSYAGVCGWRATEASLQRDLDRFGSGAPLGAPSHGSGPLASPGFQRSRPQQAGAGAGAGAGAAALWMTSGVAVSALPETAGPPALQLPEASNPAQPGEDRALGTARRRATSWQVGSGPDMPRHLSRGKFLWRYLCLSISALCAPVEREERESYRAFWQAYASQQIWLITLLDVASLSALLFRGRHSHLLSPTNIVTMIACCVGVLTATARLVLPYMQWLYLAEMTKVPRHICYCITKGLIGLAGFPAPPGIVAYELGLPVFILEAVIVPWSCLLSVATSVVVSAVKAPFYLAIWYRLTLVALEDAEREAPKAGCPEAVAAASSDAPCLHGPSLGLGNAQSAAMLSYLSLYHRLIRVLILSSLFVMVTAACNAHMRAAYERHKRNALLGSARVAGESAAVAGRVGTRRRGVAVVSVLLQHKKWE